MTALTRALGAETLKLKRTLALWLIVGGPLAAVALSLLAFVARGNQIIDETTNPYLFVAGNAFGIWTMLLLTPFIALECALLGQQEHSNSGWKHICTLATPRWVTYAAKQLVALAVFALSHLALVVEIALLVLFVRMLHLAPEMNYTVSFPWRPLLGAALSLSIASWFMIAIHTWLGLRWPSFPGVMSIAAVAMVVGLMVGTTRAGWYFPWSMGRMALVALEPEQPEMAMMFPMLLCSIAGAAIITSLGIRDFNNRDIV